MPRVERLDIVCRAQRYAALWPLHKGMIDAGVGPWDGRRRRVPLEIRARDLHSRTVSSLRQVPIDSQLPLLFEKLLEFHIFSCRPFITGAHIVMGTIRVIQVARIGWNRRQRLRSTDNTRSYSLQRWLWFGRIEIGFMIMRPFGPPRRSRRR